MHFAIMLTLDPATAGVMEDMERQIADVHALHRPFDSEVGPHVTLAACEDLDLTACASLLDALAGRFGDRRVQFGSLGVFTFDPAVVFAAPVVTSSLLDHHARFHRALAGIASGSAPHYAPDNWVPHCTLAERIPPALLPQVITIARTLPLPLDGRFAAVQVAEFPAAKIVHSVAIVR